LDFLALLALFRFMASDTGAHLHTVDAMAADYPGVGTMGFAHPDTPMVCGGPPTFSHGRQLASLHHDTTFAGNSA